ncbi:MAG TPA: hypothetical protein VNL35_01150 [Chloroflexota bacterium]|nr:hypothetical protein [Chloroflexota bacterium]
MCLHCPHYRSRPPTLDASWYAQALAADPRVVFLPTQAQTMIAVATGNVVFLAAAPDAVGRGDAATTGSAGTSRLGLGSGPGRLVASALPPR